MAIIQAQELKELVKSNSNYLAKWELGAPIEQAFGIKFGKPTDQAGDIESIDFELADGSTLVLDIGKDKKVYGIEIC